MTNVYYKRVGILHCFQLNNSRICPERRKTGLVGCIRRKRPNNYQVSSAVCHQIVGHPVMFFPLECMKPESYYTAPHETLPLIFDSGYMNSEIIVNKLKHFQVFAKSCEDYPTLLIFSNHLSLRFLSAVLYCREDHIMLVSSPAHATHMVKPLDRSFFGPFKTAYSAEVDRWMTTNAV